MPNHEYVRRTPLRLKCGLPDAYVDGASGDSGPTRPGSSDSAAPSEAGAGERAGTEPISGNLAAVNIVAGTGVLGRLLGLDEESGVRLGGLWFGDASGILSGGRDPGR